MVVARLTRSLARCYLLKILQTPETFASQRQCNMCRSRFACSHNTVTRQLKDILGEKNPPNKQLCFYLLDMDDFACISKNHLFCFSFRTDTKSCDTASRVDNRLFKGAFDHLKPSELLHFSCDIYLSTPSHQMNSDRNET